MSCLAQTRATRNHEKILQALVDYTGSLLLYEYSKQISYNDCMHGLTYPVNRPHNTEGTLMRYYGQYLPVTSTHGEHSGKKEGKVIM
jgi:hypothetical protein